MELSQFINEVAARGIWFNIGHWFVILSTLALGLLAYRRSPRNLNNKAFFYLNISFSIWSFSMYVANIYTLPHGLFLFNFRLTYLLGFVVCISYLNFCLTFPEQNSKKPLYFWAALFVAVTLAFMGLLTDWFLKDFALSKQGFVYVTKYNPFLYVVLVIAYALLLFGSTALLFTKIKEFKGRKKRQLHYVFIGSILTIISVFATDLIPPFFGTLIKSSYGALGIMIFVAFTSTAVIKHRLLDIRLVAIKSAVYTALIGLLASVYVFSVFYLKKYYEGIINPDGVFIVASFAVAFGFQPLKKLLQKYADRIFAKGHYDFEELLKKISNILSTNLTRESLSTELIRILSTQMKIRKIAFVLKDSFRQMQGLNLTKPQTTKLFGMCQLSQALVADELEDDSHKKQIMRELGVEVLISFPDEDKVLGFMAFGEKASGDAYSSSDLKLLEIIAPQISITLKNIEQQEQMIENIVEERQRINQDAHDHIYNRLGGLAKKAEVAMINPGMANNTLNLLKDDLRKTVDDLQKIVSGQVVDEQNGDQALVLEQLEIICRDFSAQSSIEVEHHFDKSFLGRLDSKHYWHLQCILEECLNNVRKHSQAKKASVVFSSANDSIILEVKDDGIGITKAKDNSTQGSHQGLKGMKERAEKIDGKLSFSSNGNGTTVKLEIKT